jgi:trimeric autotransporter adhesin
MGKTNHHKIIKTTILYCTVMLHGIRLLIIPDAICQSFAPLPPGFIGGGFVREIFYDSTSNLLYAGGDFRYLRDGTPMQHISKWNGSYWDSLAGGIEGGGSVSALALYNGELIVGGGFYTATGANPPYHLRRWNGSQWLAFPSASGNIVNDPVVKARVFNNELYICGYFTIVNGMPAQGIARYDGTNWHTYPDIGPSFDFVYVSDMIIYNNELYVGGNFHGPPGLYDIAKFDGTNWVSVGGGFSGGFTHVTSMVEYQGKLCVAGGFRTSFGDPGNNIALWDGAFWSQLGAGIGPAATVLDIVVYNNYLFAGGGFTQAGGNPVSHIAKWDGQAWSGIGGTFNSGIHSFCNANGNLYIGGQFSTISNDTMWHITEYNLPVGLNNVVEEPNYTLYPNPSVGSVTIEIPYSNCNSTRIEIFNGMLELVQTSVITKNESVFKLNEDNAMKPGIYFCKIVSKTGFVVQRIIIQ